MAIDKQTRLEEEGISKRKELLLQLNYRKGENTEYNENNPDALATGDPQGKGLGTDMGFSLPDRYASKTNKTHNIITDANLGGKYDIEGTQGVVGAYQGRSGRDYLMGVNLYSRAEEYGQNSIDTTVNRMDGQFFVK